VNGVDVVLLVEKDFVSVRESFNFKIFFNKIIKRCLKKENSEINNKNNSFKIKEENKEEEEKGEEETFPIPEVKFKENIYFLNIIFCREYLVN